MIDDFGEQHLATGDLIVYTSADSVLQIAAHVDEVPPAELYAACAAAREIMTRRARRRPRDRAAVPRRAGRVRAHRRAASDLALAAARRAPTWRSCRPRGVPVHTVGKVEQVFAGVGVDRGHPGADQRGGDRAATERADRRARRRPRVHQPRRDRPGLRPPQRRRRASTRRCRRSTPRSAAGSSASTPSATCSSSPPTTAATRPRPAPTTRASTRRCSRASPATAGAATTGRSPTSAPPCCAGSPGATPPRCPASRSSP